MKIGDVVLKVTMARFSRTLATLVAAGVDIIQALEITGQTAGNWVVEDALADVRARSHEGVPIAQPLIENPVFPPMVSQMVKIGEETGELEKMLGKIADFYEDEVDASIQSLTSIIEPLMMIVVGVDGRRDHHRDVPADVQDAHARQVAPPRLLRQARLLLCLPSAEFRGAQGETPGETNERRLLIAAVLAGVLAGLAALAAALTGSGSAKARTRVPHPAVSDSSSSRRRRRPRRTARPSGGRASRRRRSSRPTTSARCTSRATTARA